MIPKAVEEFCEKHHWLIDHTDYEMVGDLLTHPDSPVKQALDAGREYGFINNRTNRAAFLKALAALEVDK